jgi:hypothetical protein
MQVFEPNVFMQCAPLMAELKQELLDNGVQFQPVREDIQSTRELAGFPIVAICAGLGSGRLAGDHRVHPVLGHTVRLLGQDRSTLDYTLSQYSAEVEEAGVRFKRATYMHPAPAAAEPAAEVGLVGGTFIPVAPEQLTEAQSRREFDGVISRVREFFYGPQAVSWP